MKNKQVFRRVGVVVSACFLVIFWILVGQKGTGDLAKNNLEKNNTGSGIGYDLKDKDKGGAGDIGEGKTGDGTGTGNDGLGSGGGNNSDELKKNGASNGGNAAVSDGDGMGIGKNASGSENSSQNVDGGGNGNRNINRGENGGKSGNDAGKAGSENGGGNAGGGNSGVGKNENSGNSEAKKDNEKAIAGLNSLAVKGRAPKKGYNREEFYKTWPVVNGCNLRQRIIRRELGASAKMNGCDVVGGGFLEPYTGVAMNFSSKAEISKKIQIDHVVALSDAWQKGAQDIGKQKRYELATDPLNLIAVDGPANMQKGDGDAATWLPKNRGFWCQYVQRQVAVKVKYVLWVTQAEKDKMAEVLAGCW